MYYGGNGWYFTAQIWLRFIPKLYPWECNLFTGQQVNFLLLMNNILFCCNRKPILGSAALETHFFLFFVLRVAFFFGAGEGNREVPPRPCSQLFRSTWRREIIYPLYKVILEIAFSDPWMRALAIFRLRYYSESQVSFRDILFPCLDLSGQELLKAPKAKCAGTDWHKVVII